jgi:tripartite-type tricarboxylate transporter receptor subunit TctC
LTIGVFLKMKSLSKTNTPNSRTKREMLLAALSVSITGIGLSESRLALAQAAQVPTASEIAQYPNKSIQLVMGFPPGGSGDFIGRLIGDEMSKLLGQQVVPINKPGAATNIASEFVARAAGDGYTLLLGGSFSHSVNPALFTRLPYDPIRSFSPIGKVASLPTVFVVPATLPVNTLQEFISYAKREGEKVNYASAGIGSPGHIAGGYFNKFSNLQMTHVPYKGAGEAVRGLISGDVQLIITSPTSIMSFVKQGRAKALAMTTAKPSPLVPGVPGAEEAGLKNFDMDGWYGLYAPANVPTEIITKLSRALNQALAQPVVKEKFELQGATLDASANPDSFGKFGQADRLRWATIVKDSGVKME